MTAVVNKRKGIFEWTSIYEFINMKGEYV